jgi:chemotaxis protein CheD
MEELPVGYIEVFLGPGEHYFGDHETRVRTLLGSCIAVTMWHPKYRIGGMCHFLVPARAAAAGAALDGRYGVEAMGLLINDAEKAGTSPRDYQFKVFGGGNMFPGMDQKAGQSVGAKNIDCAQEFLEASGFAIESGHFGGSGYRNIVFDVWSGHVWLKHRNVMEGELAAYG